MTFMGKTITFVAQSTFRVSKHPTAIKQRPRSMRIDWSVCSRRELPPLPGQQTLMAMLLLCGSRLDRSVCCTCESRRATGEGLHVRVEMSST